MVPGVKKKKKKKLLANNAGDIKRHRPHPWLRKIPWSRNRHPLSVLAWRIAWTEEPGGLWSIGSPSTRDDWSNLAQHILNIWKSKSLSRVRLLCDPMDYTVDGIVRARILEWVTFPFARGSSQSRDQTQVSRIAGRLFTSWATREDQEYWSG